MSFININGKILPATEAATPADNGAFRYGYGLFETMLVQGGAIRLKEYHWERLFAGLKQLYLEPPAHLTAASLEEQVLKTVRKNNMQQLCRVRLQMYAAGGGLYGLTATSPSYLIECFPLEESTLLLNDNGLVAGIAEGLNKSNDSLANLKSCNALIYAMAARQAKKMHWNDALICNTQGNIIESAIANIFWVKDNVVYTPPISEGCVAGVMRRYIIEMVKDISEIPLTKEALATADEVFLTNAIKGIRWVQSIGDTSYTNTESRKIAAFINPE